MPTRRTRRAAPQGWGRATGPTPVLDFEAPVMRLRMRLIAAAVAASAAVGPAGCATVTRVFAPKPVADNPLLVPTADVETVWRETIAVLD